MYVAAPNGTMVTAIARAERGRAGEDAPVMEAFDAWELRWIARELPTLDAAWLPPSSLDPALRGVDEHDVYVLTRSDWINLKVRHRENSVKLKRLVERTDDGFERWRTEFDVPLPAGPQRFGDVLDLIGTAGSPERLGAAAQAGEMVEILDAICDPSQLVAVHKSRHLFQRGTCCVDEVRFRTRGAPTVPWGSRAPASTTFARSCRTWTSTGWVCRATTQSSSRSVADKATGTATALGNAKKCPIRSGRTERQFCAGRSRRRWAAVSLLGGAPRLYCSRMRKLVVATLALSLVAACGGSDGESEPSDTDAPSESIAPGESDAPDAPADTDAPAQDVAADSAAAEAALLTLSDFPAGWSEVPDEEDDSNQELLEQVYECLGPDAVELINSETEAQTGSFTDPVDESTVDEIVALAPTEESAEAYMAGGSADGVAECLTTAYREGVAELLADAEEMQGAELGEITVGALNVGEIGEDSFAYRITVPISVQGVNVDLFADFVAVRVGRSAAGLNFSLNSTRRRLNGSPSTQRSPLHGCQVDRFTCTTPARNARSIC